MLIRTVNVLEWKNSTIQSITSFSDDDAGNKEAEELFAKLAKNSSFDEGDVEIGLDNGYLDSENSDYQIYIVHSYCRELGD